MFSSKDPASVIRGSFILYLLNCILPEVHCTYKEDEAPSMLRTVHRQHAEANLKSESFLDAFAYTASTDESKLRLALLVDDKIDVNKDGLVQLDELVTWLKVCQDKYAEEDVNRHWILFGKSIEDSQSSINWNEYKQKEYDDVLSLTKLAGNLEHNTGIRSAHDERLQKDLRRWKAADFNGDGRLSKNEFKSFSYPEHDEKMHALLVDEKFESLDRDKNGRISFEEYIADVTNDSGLLSKGRNDDWLKNERTKFSKLWDTDHDNHLDRSELAILISKSELDDHSVAEAQHLMQSADTNRDHRLSKEEILTAYPEFINSHVTDFGEALRSREKLSHDEL